MLNGFTANLPDDTIIESGVLFIGNTPIGVSDGGFKFDPGKTEENVPYDGKKSDVQTIDRIIKWNPKITGQLIEFGGTSTGKQIDRLEPGSTSTTHDKGATTRIQPKAAGVVFATNEYLTDLRVMYERLGGGYAAVLFSIAKVSKYSIEGRNEKAGAIPVEFTPRLSVTDATNSPGKCPFAIELRTSTPS